MLTIQGLQGRPMPCRRTVKIAINCCHHFDEIVVAKNFGGAKWDINVDFVELISAHLKSVPI
jgi:hypothetical protein